YIIVASGVLSAIFLNDTIVLVFTPLVLDICLALNQRPIPYLIALVTAANIGSVATIIGNPQNMLIGVSSEIPFNTFTAYLAPVALAGMVVIWVVVALVFRRDFGARLVKEPVVGLHTETRLLRKSLLATGVMIAGFVLGFPIPLAALVGAAILLISRRI
ncbi:MAG: anion transporter, partial [Caldilineaceae bacterium]|nr:anion transporter [Caldilineaceae bacterium]